MDAKQKPVHEVSLGRIRVTIWGRNSGSGSTEYYSVPSRIYKDDEDQWTQTNGYWPEDLPVLLKLLDLAAVWIWRQKSRAMSARVND